MRRRESEVGGTEMRPLNSVIRGGGEGHTRECYYMRVRPEKRASKERYYMLEMLPRACSQSNS